MQAISNKFMKWYAFYFMCLFEFFNNGPGSWGGKSKAIVVFLFLEMLLVLTAMLLCAIALDIQLDGLLSSLDSTAWISFPLAFALYYVNHMLLFREQQWQMACRYFYEMSPTEKSFGKAVVFFVTLLIPFLYFVILVAVGKAKGIF